MGAIDWIRQVFGRQKERVDKAAEQAQGFTGEPSGLDIYSYYGLDAIGDYLRVDQDLVARYLDYNEMLIYPEIDAAVTLYAEDATQPNTMTGDTVWVESDDEEVRDDLNHMLKKRLNIEDEIWGIARTLVTYGNGFEEILATAEEGVVGLNFLPPETMRRFEAAKGQLIGFIQDPAGQFRVKPNELEDIIKKKTSTPAGVVPFEDWQVVHFRLQSKFRQSPYGVSVMEGARWIWKRLLLLEDALMIYRLTRAPSRFAFYVDIGEMPPRQALRYMEQVRQKFRKKKFVNPVTGRLDMRSSPIAQDEDFYVPVRGGRESTRIDVLQGPDFPGCLAGDTQVHLLDGRDLTIKELTDQHRPGMTYPILSVDPNGKIVPDVAYDPRMTQKNAEVYEVVIDDKGKHSKVICTGNHPFRLRFGQDAYKRADQLKSGDRLMPFNRRLSRDDWDGQDGYPMVYDPGTGKDEFVHKIVARKKFGFEKVPHGHMIHHNGGCLIDGHAGCCLRFCKLNNHPDSLLLPTVEEHGKIHAEFGREIMARNWKKWRKDSNFLKERSQRSVAGWKANGTGAKMSAFWNEWYSDPVNLNLRCGANNGMARTDLSFELFVKTVQEQKLTNSKQLKKALNCTQGTYERIIGEHGLTGREFFRKYSHTKGFLRPDFTVERMIQVAEAERPYSWGDLATAMGANIASLYQILARNGWTMSEFSAKYLGSEGRVGARRKIANHVVVSVRKLSERMDVYDLSVQKNHNFAVNDSVFVHNSIDDVLYLYKKLLVALKIPPAYLGLDESVSAKNVLAHEDVRFARSVLRIQRELRNGIKKVCTVHLASRNIDPESVDYDVFMTVPSGIYELAQMEIRKARVEFAELLGDWVSKRWVMREILGFSDDQIDQINDEKKAEEAGGSASPAERVRVRRPVGPPPGEGLGDLRGVLLPGERVKQSVGRRVLTEDINHGNKDFEGWLKKNLGKVLEGNVNLGKRLGEVRGLCQDLRMKVGRNGSSAPR